MTVITTRILDQSECKDITEQVDRLRSRWIERMVGAFYTLGVAAYLDAPDPAAIRINGVEADREMNYEARWRDLNPLLDERFSELYARVLREIENVLGDPAELCDSHARPGFQIFHSHPRFARRKNLKAHVDRPYEGVDWGDTEDLQFDRTLSFTLPLDLPAVGGGIRIWDLNCYSAPEWTEEQIRARFAAARSTLYPYHLGTLLVHSGHQLHQIEPWPHVPGQRRVTLQGHGVFERDRWLIYF